MKPVPDPDAAGPDAELAARLRAALCDPAPPQAVLARAIARDGALRRAAAALRRLIAEPVLDAGAGFGAIAGVRSAGSLPRQLLFRAEACEVDIRVQALGSSWVLAGQVLGAPEARLVVLSGAGSERVVELGPTAEFSFVDVTAATYDLTVRTPEVDIVVPGLKVGVLP